MAKRGTRPKAMSGQRGDAEPVRFRERSGRMSVRTLMSLRQSPGSIHATPAPSLRHGCARTAPGRRQGCANRRFDKSCADARQSYLEIARTLARRVKGGPMKSSPPAREPRQRPDYFVQKGSPLGRSWCRLGRIGAVRINADVGTKMVRADGSIGKKVARTWRFAPEFLKMWRKGGYSRHSCREAI